MPQKLTEAAVLKKLTAWQARHDAFKQSAYRVMYLFGGTFEDPFLSDFLALFNAYQREIEIQLDDQQHWLDYYRFECDMGQKPKTIKLIEGTEIQLDSLEKLAQLITGE